MQLHLGALAPFAVVAVWLCGAWGCDVGVADVVVDVDVGDNTTVLTCNGTPTDWRTRS